MRSKLGFLWQTDYFALHSLNNTRYITLTGLIVFRKHRLYKDSPSIYSCNNALHTAYSKCSVTGQSLINDHITTPCVNCEQWMLVVVGNWKTRKAEQRKRKTETGLRRPAYHVLTEHWYLALVRALEWCYLSAPVGSEWWEVIALWLRCKLQNWPLPRMRWYRTDSALYLGSVETP